MCADCMDKYYRSGAFECKKCPQFSFNIVVLTFATIFVIGVIILLVNSMI